MLNLARGLADLGFPTDLVLAKKQGPYLKDVPGNVRLVDLQAKHTMLSLPQLIYYLRRERPEAVVAALHQAGVTAVWAKNFCKFKLVISTQNTVSVEAAQPASWRLRFMPGFVRRFYPGADALIGVSDGVAADLADFLGLPRDRTQVIYNAVISPNLPERAAEPLDHAWFGPGQLPVLVAVGRLGPQKDFPTLLKAFRLVRNQREARLIILGEGDDRPQLEALVHQLKLDDDVQLPGFALNPFAYLHNATVFVLSSKWEGLPTVIIEALGCGARVVATDCPSGPMEILQGGKFGRLVPMEDPTALASAILLTLAEPSEPPPSESWQPYRIDSVARCFAALLAPEVELEPVD